MVDWWCGVAVFVGSATQLLYVLIWPLCVGAMGVIATSQVLYTLDDCTAGGICSISDAYTVVYYMILGEPVLSDGSDFARNITVVMGVFTVLWIWWLFSAIAMTISEAFHLDRRQLALAWYWEPKVTLTIMATSGNDRKFSETPSFMEQYCDDMEVMWDVLFSALRGEQSDGYWDAWCMRSKMSTFLTGILALFVIPLWLTVGLFTLGLLWPPQVRRWVFRPSDASSGPFRRHSGNNVTPEEDGLTRAKLSQLRGDIIELKAVAYDQNYNIQKDLGFLKDVIYRAVMDDDYHDKNL
jgi:hypothetical protein